MENLDAVRAGLGPRALLTVWPDLVPDVGAVLAALPEEGPVEFVWEERTARSATRSSTTPSTSGPPPWWPARGRPAPCPWTSANAARRAAPSCRMATVCCEPAGDRVRAGRP
ncbi:hypothetical protein [Streptomyces sp. NPDC091383]|uniref:hypothetical protein n=1 Tax=Streptomyces sp. NPDC091383 TaxID=3365996 RepID=UPI0037F48AA6